MLPKHWHGSVGKEGERYSNAYIRIRDKVGLQHHLKGIIHSLELSRTQR